MWKTVRLECEILWTEKRYPQGANLSWCPRTAVVQIRRMYNIVLYQELESAGVPTRTIRQALRCCLLKL